MSDRSTAFTLGKQIGVLFDQGALGAMSDRGLLELFARGGDPSEAAFGTLVERHGPMVLRVAVMSWSTAIWPRMHSRSRSCCWHVGHARSMIPMRSAGWLHRVARRVALRARAGIHGHDDREDPKTVCVDIAVSEADPVERDELGAVIHEEIDRLVDAQRLAYLAVRPRGPFA